MNLDEYLDVLLKERGHAEFLAALPTPQNRTDAVDFRIGHPFLTERLPLQAEDDPIHTLVYRRLGHIHIDPKDHGAVAAINAAYVCPGGEGPNGSPESATALVQALIDEAARQAAHPAEGSGATNPSGAPLETISNEVTRLFVLHGTRGMGKTFFLNYMLANNLDLLIHNRIIWARIDLSRDVEKGFTIYRRVVTKAAKILLRYVDEDSAVANRVRDLSLDRGMVRIGIAKRALESLRSGPYDEDTIDEVRLRLDSLRQEFGQQESSAPLDLHTVPEILGNLILEEARQVDFKFLAILDGLDRLEATERAQRLFDRLLKELREFTVARVTNWAILVICRTASVADVLQQHNPSQIPKERVIRLDDAALDDIVEKRFDVISAELKLRSAERRPPQIDATVLQRWEGELERFRLSLIDNDIERILPGRNRRQQLQVVQNKYLQIPEIERRYHTVELLTLSGRCFPPKFFRYAWSHNGRPIQMAHDPVPLDYRFLPGIFAYPEIFDETERPNECRGINALPMLNIRILQLLDAFAAVRDGGAVLRDDGFILEDIYGLLQLFGYQRQEVLSSLEYLMEFDLVDLSGGVLEWASNPARIHATVLPKGQALLNIMLSDIAYLNLAAMRFPISREAAAGDIGLFHAASVLISTTETRRWLEIKILNSATVCWLCGEFNRMQEPLLTEKRVTGVRAEEHKTIVREARRRGMFDFHLRSEADLRDQCRKALRVLPTGEQSAVYAKLAAYCRRWIPRTLGEN